MSKRNQMPGLRRKAGVWHIEKRCKHLESGWLRESTGQTSRIEAEQYLIRRLVGIENQVERKHEEIYLFEEGCHALFRRYRGKALCGCDCLSH